MANPDADERLKAWQYDGAKLQLVERPDPVPGPGQVVVDVLAAGLCHSDLTLMGRAPEAHPFALPLVLGHEIAGVVSATGAGVSEVDAGDRVVVYGPRGCGRCRTCATGAENLCPHAREAGILPPGLGAAGGLAGQVLVDSSRHVFPIGGIDPVQAAPLTDAGLTSYSAVRQSLPTLTPEGTVVVVGVGGLGHVAVQVLRALTACRVVAVDVSPAARDLAARLGADLVLDPTEQPPVDVVRELTGGVGADLVLDFVASDGTLASSAAMLRRGGELSLVGVGSGALPVSVGRIPLGAGVRTPYWGTRQDLLDVLALAASGRVCVEVETFGLEEAVKAYERLREGSLTGRAVVLPGGVR